MAAGLIRRGAALWLDAVVAALPLVLAMSLFGTLVRMDEHLNAFIAIMVPGIIGALGYVFVGAGLLENTYGRHVFGVRVRDLNGGRPSLGQALVRSLTLSLWPVEALLVAFGKEKRRLGDRLAGTAVETYRPTRSAGYRGAAAALIGLLGFLGLMGATPLINARMTISGVAQAHLAEQGIDAGTPRTVRVVNDQGSVIFKISDELGVRVNLERLRGSWTVVGTADLDADQIGWWSYSVESFR